MRVCNILHIHTYICTYKYKEVYGPELGTSESEDRNPREEAHHRTQQRSSDSRACSSRRGRQASPGTTSLRRRRRCSGGIASPCSTGTPPRRSEEEEAEPRSSSPACALGIGISATGPAGPNASGAFSQESDGKVGVGESLLVFRTSGKCARNGSLNG